jgi:hypothetical protein
MITRELKALARELNIPVIALSQLSRAVESRQSKIPQLSDLRESGSIEQDSDVVMFLYRDELYNPETERPGQIDVLVAKHRNGPLGEVSLRFDKARSRFEDLEVSPPLDEEENQEQQPMRVVEGSVVSSLADRSRIDSAQQSFLDDVDNEDESEDEDLV